MLLNKQEIFTPLGHKKSCSPDLEWIAEVTTMAFCQIIIEKYLTMPLQNFKEKSTKDDREWVKDVLYEENHVGVYLKEFHYITFFFFACKQTEVSTMNLKCNAAILEPIKDKK